MIKPNLSKIVLGARKAVTEHSPQILTGMGLACMALTVASAVKDTTKAVELIKEKKEELHTDELTVEDTVKTTWKCYIPTVLSGCASAAFILGANSVYAKRAANLATLATTYNITKTAFDEYRDAVVETIGEKKEQQVRDKVAENKVKNNPVNSEAVIVTSKGNTLCMEGITGQYFRSDIEAIRRIENDIREEMNSGGMYISLNEVLSRFGLRYSGIGDQIGWNTDHGRESFKILFSSCLTDNGEPCLVIDYKYLPDYNFDTLV